MGDTDSYSKQYVNLLIFDIVTYVKLNGKYEFGVKMTPLRGIRRHDGSVNWLNGNDEGEGAALFGSAFEPDTAVIRFHQRPNNRKSHANPP